MAETHRFQAEISQLMGLIINTFYSNKEIFLRELVSNASDALDKLRYLSLTHPEVLEGEPELKIQLIPKRDEKLLIIRDTGVGMTKADLTNNLGTIARSGTKQFMEAVEAGGDMSLIGQFGVGFYSAFLVASQVDVFSKSNDDECHVWSSSAGGSFTVSAAQRPDLKRGTEIVLHIKDGCEEYLRDEKIKEIIKAHSQYVGFPIELHTTTTEEVEEEEEEQSEKEEEPAKEEEEEKDGEPAEASSDDEDEDEDASEGSKKKGKKKPKKTIKRTVEGWNRLNTEPAIWTRKPGTVSHAEYASFYKNLTNDWEDHLAVKHFHVEGHVDFKGILYIPRRAPFDMFESRKKRVGIKLFVRKVFITDECTDLVPEWLSFVKGVVDSDDLPLNISRETLQKNTVITNMRGVIIKKIIELLTELSTGKYIEGPQEKKDKKEGDSEDEDSDADDDTEEKSLKLWRTFYEQFSRNLKLGVHEDSSNRERLASLLRFYSTKSSEEMASLDGYVERMKEHQKSIYYLTSESRRHCETSPFLEALKAKDFEVIFMDQAIDEYAVSTLREYKGKKLQCITKDGLELEETEEEKKKHEDEKANYSKLVDFIKEVLGDKIENVKIGYRLTTTPCVLTTSEWGWSAQMQRIMKAQALRDDSMSSVMSGKPTMEINPNSKLIRTLKKMLDEDPENVTLRSSAVLLFETAQISSGFSIDNVSSYAVRIYSMMAFGLAGDDDEEVEMPGLTGEEAPAQVEEPVEEEAVDDAELETID